MLGDKRLPDLLQSRLRRTRDITSPLLQASVRDNVRTLLKRMISNYAMSRQLLPIFCLLLFTAQQHFLNRLELRDCKVSTCYEETTDRISSFLSHSNIKTNVVCNAAKANGKGKE